MDKILDREEQIKLKTNKTWIIIVLTNVILVGIIFLGVKSAQEVGKLIIAGIGSVALLALNPLISVILLSFTDSKEWKKWCFAAFIVSSIMSVLYFSFVF